MGRYKGTYICNQDSLVEEPGRDVSNGTGHACALKLPWRDACGIIIIHSTCMQDSASTYTNESRIDHFSHDCCGCINSL